MTMTIGLVGFKLPPGIYPEDCEYVELSVDNLLPQEPLDGYLVTIEWMLPYLYGIAVPAATGSEGCYPLAILVITSLYEDIATLPGWDLFFNRSQISYSLQPSDEDVRKASRMLETLKRVLA